MRRASLQRLLNADEIGLLSLVYELQPARGITALFSRQERYFAMKLDRTETASAENGALQPKRFSAMSTTISRRAVRRRTVFLGERHLVRLTTGGGRRARQRGDRRRRFDRCASSRPGHNTGHRRGDKGQWHVSVAKLCRRALPL